MTGAFRNLNSVELDDAAVTRIVRAYKSDERPGIEALARRFGRSQEKIRQILVEHGVEIFRGRR